MPARPIATMARDLAAVGRQFHARGWVPGTSGNFSEVVSRKPFRLAITQSGADKGALRSGQIIQVDQAGTRIGRGRELPSAETLLHLEIIRRRGAGAVLHTHSVWGTLLSERYAERGWLEIEGFEMLKPLHGVTTHAHLERVPVIANDQDMTRLATVVGATLEKMPDAHAFLLQRHGLYTWGQSLKDAVRHVEALEFLFEVVGRGEG